MVYTGGPKTEELVVKKTTAKKTKPIKKKAEVGPTTKELAAKINELGNFVDDCKHALRTQCITENERIKNEIISTIVNQNKRIKNNILLWTIIQFSIVLLTVVLFGIYSIGMTTRHCDNANAAKEIIQGFWAPDPEDKHLWASPEDEHLLEDHLEK